LPARRCRVCTRVPEIARLRPANRGSVLALHEHSAGDTLRMLTAADRKLKGRTVRFRVKDIYHPEPVRILHQLHDNEQLRGRVLDLSDCAKPSGSPFVVVKVAGLPQECLVPVDRLLCRRKAPVGL
jgi:hypothetical protein